MIKFLFTIFLTISANAQFNFWHSSLWEKLPKAWPYGSLGDLVVDNGEVKYLDYGQNYDYQNIHIKYGGTLIIRNQNYNSPDFKITTLGAAGNFIVDGLIRTQQMTMPSSDTSNYTTYYGSIPKSSTTNMLTVSYQFIQRQGGNGGQAVTPGGCCMSNGGSPAYGNGGGGSGQEGTAGQSAALSNGGKGGNGRSCGIVGQGGSGGTISSPNGQSGTYGYNCYSGYGAGGGGGFRGYHALPLAIKVKGSIAGSGEINTSGFQGGSGGSGGQGLYNGPSGGSGAGGNAGQIWIYYNTSTINANVFSINSISTNQISVICTGGLGGSIIGPNQSGTTSGQSGVSCNPILTNIYIK